MTKKRGNNHVHKHPVRVRTLSQAVRLSGVASAIGTVLFIVITTVSSLPSAKNAPDELVAFIMFYAFMGTLVGFAISLLPSIVAGIMITTFLRIWKNLSKRLIFISLVLGILIGGGLGFLLVSVVYFTQYGTWSKVFVASSAILSGSIAGGWYVRQMLRWFEKDHFNLE